MKRILILVLILLLCKQPSKKDVTFWHAMGGPLGKTLEQMIENFEKESGIEIKSVSMSNYTSLAQKLMGATLVKNPPSLAQMYESWAVQFYKKGILKPIDDFINSEEGFGKEELQDFYPVFLEISKYKGKFLTFPFNKSLPVIFYNKKIFAENGIKSPPKTWDEFLEIAKKLTKDEDNDGVPEVWGTAFNIDPWWFNILVLQNGGKLIDPQNKKVLFACKEGVEALEFLNTLVNKEKCAYIASGYQHQDDFLSGKVAMIIGTIVSWSFMREKMSFPVGIAPLPYGKKKVTIIAGTNVGIFEGVPAEEQKKAWRFIKWFISPAQQAYWSSHTFYLPVRRSAKNYEPLKSLLEEMPELKEIYAQLEYATSEPSEEIWFKGRRYLRDAIEKTLRGNISAEQALLEAKQKIEEEWK